MTRTVHASNENARDQKGIMSHEKEQKLSDRGGVVSEAHRAEHSPGPWHVSDHYDAPGAIIAADGYPVAEVEDTSILEGWDQLREPKDRRKRLGHWSHSPGEAYIERSDVEVLANARLIAAAPDLLEACTRAAEWLMRFGAGPENVAWLHAAIAKATGTES